LGVFGREFKGVRIGSGDSRKLISNTRQHLARIEERAKEAVDIYIYIWLAAWCSKKGPGRSRANDGMHAEHKEESIIPYSDGPDAALSIACACAFAELVPPCRLAGQATLPRHTRRAAGSYQVRSLSRKSMQRLQSLQPRGVIPGLWEEALLERVRPQGRPSGALLRGLGPLEVIGQPLAEEERQDEDGQRQQDVEDGGQDAVVVGGVWPSTALTAMPPKARTLSSFLSPRRPLNTIIGLLVGLKTESMVVVVVSSPDPRRQARGIRAR
jgi:hypothetical protein